MSKPIKFEKAMKQFMNRGTAKGIAGIATLALGALASAKLFFEAGEEFGKAEGCQRHDDGVKLQFLTAIRKGIMTDEQVDKFYSLDPEKDYEE